MPHGCKEFIRIVFFRDIQVISANRISRFSRKYSENLLIKRKIPEFTLLDLDGKDHDWNTKLEEPFLNGKDGVVVQQLRHEKSFRKDQLTAKKGRIGKYSC